MKTDPHILLGRTLQKLIDQGYCQVKGYNRFVLKEYSHNKVVMRRENGNLIPVYFRLLLRVIKEYQDNPADYYLGPSQTREYGITHLNSPIWSILHLLDKEDNQ